MRTAAAVAFLITGILELLFACLSVMGVMLGVFMSAGGLDDGRTNSQDVEALGPMLLVFYALWLVVTAIAGPLHIRAAANLLMGGEKRTLWWAAVGVSVLPVVTIYCAIPSVVAGVLGLVFLLTTPVTESEQAPG